MVNPILNVLNSESSITWLGSSPHLDIDVVTVVTSTKSVKLNGRFHDRRGYHLFAMTSYIRAIDDASYNVWKVLGRQGTNNQEKHNQETTAESNTNCVTKLALYNSEAIVDILSTYRLHFLLLSGVLAVNRRLDSFLFLHASLGHWDYDDVVKATIVDNTFLSNVCRVPSPTTTTNHTHTLTQSSRTY